MPQRLATAQHRPGQIDRERIVPLLEIDAVETERADADADIEHHAVETAETIHRLFDHPVHIGLARDIGLDRKRAAAFTLDAPDGVVGAGAVHVGHRDMGPFPGEHQRHRPAVADRIGFGIESSLAAADHQNAAAGKPAAARRFASGFRAQFANVTDLV